MSKGKLDFIVHKLKSRRTTMIEYLKLKAEEEDWHGVADAAMDIRDIENQLLAYNDCLKNEENL